jgi:hypothetical protein
VLFKERAPGSETLLRSLPGKLIALVRPSQKKTLNSSTRLTVVKLGLNWKQAEIESTHRAKNLDFVQGSRHVMKAPDKAPNRGVKQSAWSETTDMLSR